MTRRRDTYPAEARRAQMAKALTATEDAYRRRLETYRALREQGLPPRVAARRMGLQPNTGYDLETAVTGLTPAQRAEVRRQRYRELRPTMPRRDAAIAARIGYDTARRIDQETDPC